MNTAEDVIEVGDYVSYDRTFGDGQFNALEHGSGYVISEAEFSYLVRNGDREVRVNKLRCRLRNKQYRFDV